MGNPLFGINISGLIKANMKGQLLDATLHKITPGSRTGNLTGGTNPTEVTHACEGFISTQSKKAIGGTLVEDGDILVILIGDTIDNGAAATAPITGDQVTIESNKYHIKGLDRDPAAATYTLLCKSV
jgi:hypothetical protein